jgi:hypothetical protein
MPPEKWSTPWESRLKKNFAETNFFFTLKFFCDFRLKKIFAVTLPQNPVKFFFWNPAWKKKILSRDPKGMLLIMTFNLSEKFLL